MWFRCNVGAFLTHPANMAALAAAAVAAMIMVAVVTLRKIVSRVRAAFGQQV